MLERIEKIPKEIRKRIVRENGKKIQEIKEFLILMSIASSKVPQTKSEDRIAEFQSQENKGGKELEVTHGSFRGQIKTTTPNQTANIGKKGRSRTSGGWER